MATGLPLSEKISDGLGSRTIDYEKMRKALELAKRKLATGVPANTPPLSALSTSPSKCESSSREHGVDSKAQFYHKNESLGQTTAPSAVSTQPEDQKLALIPLLNRMMSSSVLRPQTSVSRFLKPILQLSKTIAIALGVRTKYKIRRNEVHEVESRVS